ncbi:DUF771 domain-containing protein [Salinicoccus roseus]|uniref:DUF771 domain-containing protein n=1 Tax=Salinicoccus roseus TaxID=45670 RepID=A0A265E7B7_9STAP|nr:DUF771 domain-containing protein [Salinicoccus roseus]OZT77148.1 hypothetical protein CFN03_08720 [Salinicoccus roseus]
MQKLTATIPIPENYVMITKVEYEELQKNTLLGKYLTLQGLVELTGKSKPWLDEKLLSHPRRMKDIESFTHFPQSRGDKWAFKEKEMRDYLDKNFLDILRG